MFFFCFFVVSRRGIVGLLLILNMFDEALFRFVFMQLYKEMRIYDHFIILLSIFYPVILITVINHSVFQPMGPNLFIHGVLLRWEGVTCVWLRCEPVCVCPRVFPEAASLSCEWIDLPYTTSSLSLVVECCVEVWHDSKCVPSVNVRRKRKKKKQKT